MQVIDIDDEPVRHDVTGGNTNLWGLPPPRSWFEECSPVIRREGERADQKGDPLTLEKYLFAKGEKAEPLRRRA